MSASKTQTIGVIVAAVVVIGVSFSSGYFYGQSKTKVAQTADRSQAFQPGNSGTQDPAAGGSSGTRRGVGTMGNSTTGQILQLLRSASSDEQAKILQELQQVVGTTGTSATTQS